MQELSQDIKESADNKLIEVISQLQLVAQPVVNSIEIGYIFEKKGGQTVDALSDRIIGKSEKLLAIYLDSYEGNHLCARVPILSSTEYRNGIILIKPHPVEVDECITALEKVLTDFEIPFNENRSVIRPHPDYNPEKLHQLINGAVDQLFTEEPMKPFIDYPTLKTGFSYMLALDLSEGGKFKLYPMGTLYTMDASEDGTSTYQFIGMRRGRYRMVYYHNSVADIAKTVKGGMDRIKELSAEHYNLCSTIYHELIKGTYDFTYLDTTAHTKVFHIIKSMFSLRVNESDGTSDVVMHDPGNILLQKLS